MIVLTLAAGILAFAAVLHFGRAAERARAAIEIAGEAANVMRAPALSDAEKERRVQRAAIRLFGSFAAISVVSVAAFAVAAAVVWLGATIGLYRLGEAIRVAGSWPFILISSMAVLLLWVSIRYAPRRTSRFDAQ